MALSAMVDCWRARLIAASSVASCRAIFTRVALAMSTPMPTISETGRAATAKVTATFARRWRQNLRRNDSTANSEARPGKAGLLAQLQ